ncbi:MAG: putative Ig domain-containing protein, partial [Desulfomonile tiedjei]|nr:putative Ig domain-containing protein [Desulfomonile tiedjei]
GLQSYPGGPTFIGVTYSLEIFSGGTWNTVNDGDQINGPGGGLISFDDATGVFSWDTRNADVTQGNGRSPYQFRITAGDGVGTTQQAFDVTVTNAATLIDSAPGDQTITEDVGISYNIHAIDEAHDWIVGGATDIVTYYDLQVSYWDGSAFTASVDYVAYNASNGDRGDVTFDTATGQFDWVPNNADTAIGQFRFTVTHHDDNGTLDSRNFTLTVLNNPPTLTVPGWWLLHEDDTNPADYTLDQTNISSDDEGLGLTYRLFINGNEFSTSDQPNGATGGTIYFDTHTGEVRWPTTNADVTFNSIVAPVAPTSGAYIFTIEANDGNGGITTTTFQVDVYNAATDVNDVPNQVVDEDTALSLGDPDVTAIDERIGGGTFYTLEIDRSGDGAGFIDVGAYNALVTAGGGAPITFDTSTGAIDWAPRNADVGQYTFQVTHFDGHASNDADQFDVTVRNTAPEFTSSPDTSMLRPGMHFTYNPSTTDEGQHDWRGDPRDDRVVYSLDTPPSGMTVNPDTGLIQWEATLPGNYTITVLVHDGNGGIATQTFDLFVAALIDELPIEHRPDTATQNTSFGENSVFGGRDHGEKGLGLPPGVPGGLLGSTPMTSLQGRLLPDDALMPLYSGHGLEDIFKQGASGPEDLLAWLEGHDLKQPSLEPAGSTAPITPLTGYGSGVAHGQRLDFSAEELHLWQDLLQPQLVHGGSESPDTPLEGFASAIEEGRRLNFNHYPIREARAFLLEDLRAGDVLGL